MGVALSRGRPSPPVCLCRVHACYACGVSVYVPVCTCLSVCVCVLIVLLVRVRLFNVQHWTPDVVYYAGFKHPDPRMTTEFSLELESVPAGCSVRRTLSVSRSPPSPVQVSTEKLPWPKSPAPGLKYQVCACVLRAVYDCAATVSGGRRRCEGARGRSSRTEREEGEGEGEGEGGQEECTGTDGRRSLLFIVCLALAWFVCVAQYPSHIGSGAKAVVPREARRSPFDPVDSPSPGPKYTGTPVKKRAAKASFGYGQRHPWLDPKPVYDD